MSVIGGRSVRWRWAPASVLSRLARVSRTAAPSRRMAMVQGDGRVLSEGAADEIRSFLEASL